MHSSRFLSTTARGSKKLGALDEQKTKEKKRKLKRKLKRKEKKRRDTGKEKKRQEPKS